MEAPTGSSNIAPVISKEYPPAELPAVNQIGYAKLEPRLFISPTTKNGTTVISATPVMLMIQPEYSVMRKFPDRRARKTAQRSCIPLGHRSKPVRVLKERTPQGESATGYPAPNGFE